MDSSRSRPTHTTTLHVSKTSSIECTKEIEALLNASHTHELEYELAHNHRFNASVKDHLSSTLLVDHGTCVGPESLPARLVSRFDLVTQELPPHMLNKDIVKLQNIKPPLRRCLEITLKLVSQSQKLEASLKRPTGIKTKAPKKASTAFRKDDLKILGETFPTSPDEAKRLLSRLLSSQQRLLLGYIKFFLTADFKKWVQSRRTDPVSFPGSAAPTTATHPQVLQQSSLDVEVNPTRVGEFLEHEVGDLGEWPIIMCTRAFRSLGSLKDDHPNVFDLSKRKIRDLSNGHFPHYNQKVLADAEYGVPILEANLTTKLRIIYAIDCSPIRSHQNLSSSSAYDMPEMQRIRIYDICLQSQSKKGLWTSLSVYLGRLGHEYRTRCLHREEHRPLDDGRMLTPPAFFKSSSHLEEHVDHQPSNMSEADYLDLHTIILLEKYIPYSHSLLDVAYDDGLNNQMFEVSLDEERIIFYPSSCFVVGRSGTGKTTTILYKMIGLEEAFLKSDTKKRQVFLTQSPVLAKQVEEAFFNLWVSNTTRKGETDLRLGRKFVQPKHSSLLDRDSEANDMSHLPNKFSELQDHHFPLFITFHQLCILLERDIGRAYKNLLTFEQFLTSLWDHFDEKLRKDLDPSLVFSEIIGIIKGHEMAASTQEGFLDREAYMSIRRRRFTDDAYRWRIYSLFEEYILRKRRLNLNDSPERTHAILKAANQSFPGVKFDYLYVDEAQDNLIIDSCLLRMLCKSPHGLFWAGDTAQTIAPGSSFRFNDLKALFYRMEETDPAVKGGYRAAVHPKFFQLLTNYRSHSGILRPASDIVKLLMRFYPASIDSLAPEAGSTEGPKPLFLVIPHGGNQGALDQLFSKNDKTSLEFGAEQVVLVRNAQSQARLESKIGRGKALILTVYESKGLEFNDVLLYDFFADSPASAEDWRPLLEDSESQGPHERMGYTPNFNQARHGALERELKTLYVAVTRARKRLWIWDLSDRAEPLKQAWLSKRLVEERDLQDFGVLLENDTSTSEDWKRKGQQFFEKRQYAHAVTCFNRAGPLYYWEESVASAYQLRQDAQSFLHSNSRHASAWRRSAEEFRRCAAIAPSDPEKESLLSRAAQCMEEIKLYNEAADIYIEARCYENAINLYRSTRNVDRALSVLDRLSEPLRSSTTEWAKAEYTKQDEIKKARALFFKDEEYLQFLRDNDFPTQHIQFLILLGRHVEAAKLYLARDDGEPKAIELLLKAKSPAAKSMLKDIVERNIFHRFSFGVLPQRTDASAQRYMDAVKKEKLGGDEIELYEEIWKENKIRLIQLAQQFRNNKERLAHSTIAYHSALTLSTTSVKRMSTTHLGQLIDLHSEYLSLQTGLREMPVSSPTLKRLFNYKDSAVPNEYEVSRASWLYSRVKEHPRAIVNVPKRAVTLEGRYLRAIVLTAISHFGSEILYALHDFTSSLVQKQLLSGRLDLIVQVIEKLWRVVDSAHMTQCASHWVNVLDPILYDITRTKRKLPSAFSLEEAESTILAGLSLDLGRSVDVIVLIRYVEGLVGHMAVKSHICQGFLERDATATPDGVLHNLILPPTWFCATLPNAHWPRAGRWEEGRGLIVKQCSALVDLLHAVMQLLHTPPKTPGVGGRLSLNGDKLGKVTKANRMALFGRLSYSLVYLASAIQHAEIHRKITSAMRRVSTHVPRCYNRFAGTEHNITAMIETLRLMSASRPEAPVRLFYGEGPLSRAHTGSGLKCIHYLDNHDLLEKMWKLAAFPVAGSSTS